MKRRVGLGVLLWTLLISLAHVQLNVGWRALREDVAGMFNDERKELIVGFLPVT